MDFKTEILINRPRLRTISDGQWGLRPGKKKYFRETDNFLQMVAGALRVHCDHRFDLPVRRRRFIRNRLYGRLGQNPPFSCVRADHAPCDRRPRKTDRASDNLGGAVRHAFWRCHRGSSIFNAVADIQSIGYSGRLGGDFCDRNGVVLFHEDQGRGISLLFVI